MINKISLLLLLTMLLFSCQQEIDDYFNKDTETYVDSDVMSLLKANPDYSLFVELLEQYQVDTLLDKGKIYTFFVPNNDAIKSMETRDTLLISNVQLVEYLMTESYINISQINTLTKVQTKGDKFAIIESVGDTSYTYDGVSILKGSPLANNGRYYEISELVEPKPNLYQYIAATNKFYSNYIDSRDSVFLNKLLSTPVDYTDDGTTIYDPAVYEIVNRFEFKYFEITEEFRDKKATMILFDQIQYDQALSDMADLLNLDVSDISEQWQSDVLMPDVVSNSIFLNVLNYTDFLSGRLKKITGITDSATVYSENIIDDPIDCSNGRIFKFKEFEIPQELYLVFDTVPAISLLTKASGAWAWDLDMVTVTGDKQDPEVQYEKGSIVGNTLKVDMGKKFDGEFSMTFVHKNIFPAPHYKLRLRANVNGVTGIFRIYVNGKHFPIDIGDGPEDELDFFDMKGGVRSSVTREYFRFDETKPYSQFDIDVTNITEYGDVNVTLEYVGPSPKNDNSGFNIDYISLEYIK